MASEIPESAVQDYLDGASVSKIARSLRVGTNRVRDLLRERGVLRTRSEGVKAGYKTTPKEERRWGKRKGKDIDQELVTRMFSEGRTATAIASELRVSARRVHDLLTSLGMVEARGSSQPTQPRRPSVEFTCDICSVFSLGFANSKYCDVCIPDAYFRHVYTKYGISKPQYDLMLASQEGVCALCRKEDPDNVDHCHRTGTVRGILCSRCNTVLSLIDEDALWAERAVEYIKKSR